MLGLKIESILGEFCFRESPRIILRSNSSEAWKIESVLREARFRAAQPLITGRENGSGDTVITWGKIKSVRWTEKLNARYWGNKSRFTRFIFSEILSLFSQNF